MQTGLRPYFRRKYLLSKTEHLFYEILREVVKGQVILAKVRLADLVYTNDRHEKWLSNFRRVSQKHIDFVICDHELKPAIAIELDDPSHQRDDRQRRDRDVDRILAFARLPLLRIFTRRRYDRELIARLILKELRRASANRSAT
jgi:hypothetical protein